MGVKIAIKKRNLGYASEWVESLSIVKACKCKKHKIRHKQLYKHKHRISCPICGYFYHYYL